MGEQVQGKLRWIISGLLVIAVSIAGAFAATRLLPKHRADARPDALSTLSVPVLTPASVQSLPQLSWSPSNLTIPVFSGTHLTFGLFNSQTAAYGSVTATAQQWTIWMGQINPNASAEVATAQMSPDYLFAVASGIGGTETCSVEGSYPECQWWSNLLLIEVEGPEGATMNNVSLVIQRIYRHDEA
jgi:hypothetical protein